MVTSDRGCLHISSSTLLSKEAVLLCLTGVRRMDRVARATEAFIAYVSHCLGTRSFTGQVLRIRNDITMRAEERQEFLCISVDATLRCCMTLMGQASYRAPPDVRRAAAFSDEESWRRVLNVRGRTGYDLSYHIPWTGCLSRVGHDMRELISGAEPFDAVWFMHFGLCTGHRWVSAQARVLFRRLPTERTRQQLRNSYFAIACQASRQ